jgi:D-alanyl-lipoteichoic acid acyltransferase DltB (MBOAT superfamily)
MGYDAGQYFLDLLLVSCAFVPAYHLIRSTHLRQVLLVTLGMLALYTVAPRLLLFWPPYWCMIWTLAVLRARVAAGRAASIVFWVSVLLSMLPLIAWKAFPVVFPQELTRMLHNAVAAIAPPLGPIDETGTLLVPVGLSFSTFRALDYLICNHLELVRNVKLRETLAYGLFAPVLVVGPIIQYQELQSIAPVDSRELSEHFASGLTQILIGFGKLFVLAQPLADSTGVIGGFREHSTGEVWFNVFVYSWYLYLNFAGYSDIAIGTGRLYGFRLRKNFNFPYFRRNLQEFWANWHMSLTSFAQRNVFVPMGGFRKENQYIATFATMMVIALWHDVSWSLVTFGVCHASVLMALRFMHQRRRNTGHTTTGRALSTLLTYGFVALTIPLLLLEDNQILPFYRHLLGGIP